MDYQEMLEIHMEKFDRYSNNARDTETEVRSRVNAQLAEAEARIIAALIAKLD